MTSPVLVIHGTEDEVIDFSHGLAIYERCPRAVEPLWVEVRGAADLLLQSLRDFLLQGAGHNDVELYNQYLERLKTFVAHELTNWQPAGGGGDCPTTPKNQKVGVNGSKNAKKRMQGAPRDSSIDSTATVSTTSGGSKPENPSEKLL